MKILITGGSSFTGHWFIRELSAAGHEVFVTFTRPGVEHYDELRASRIGKSVEQCTPVWNCSFGDEGFLQLLKREGGFDLVCHHGAYVHDYKSPDFDVSAALQANSNNLRAVLEAMTDAGCGRMLL